MSCLSQFALVFHRTQLRGGMILNKNSVDKFFQVSKELLLEIAEDHEEADLVAQMINELVK